MHYEKNKPDFFLLIENSICQLVKLHTYFITNFIEMQLLFMRKSSALKTKYSIVTEEKIQKNRTCCVIFRNVNRKIFA